MIEGDHIKQKLSKHNTKIMCTAQPVLLGGCQQHIHSSCVHITVGKSSWPAEHHCFNDKSSIDTTSITLVLVRMASTCAWHLLCARARSSCGLGNGLDWRCGGG